MQEFLVQECDDWHEGTDDVAVLWSELDGETEWVVEWSWDDRTSFKTLAAWKCDQYGATRDTEEIELPLNWDFSWYDNRTSHSN